MSGAGGGAFAQSLAAEATAGYAGFVDDATISHVVVGWDLVSGFGWELHTRVTGTVGVQLGG